MAQLQAGASSTTCFDAWARGVVARGEHGKGRDDLLPADSGVVTLDCVLSDGDIDVGAGQVRCCRLRLQ
ncbi:hypothetical protein [Amycolatopsis pithecellobii]|uniref:Uncharacterized protein n=1 Tax=Amycolatopsis pithecellobii TaxID=664692 RepID=A0A6N7YHQ8_9PSEU|nr:hypothetical protein [Amycolatopsis pithecellobii]MTD52425.1 hypothetical protein [Amycolatopsis pithecellobii]